MARPITWREWEATQAVQPLLTVRFMITPLGRRMLRQADARRAANAEARPDACSEAQTVASCIWCRTSIRQGQAFTMVGGEPMHDVPCRREFDELTTEGR